MGELSGIAEQVEDDLFDLVLIGVDHVEAGVEFFGKTNTRLEQRRGKVNAGFSQGAHVELGGCNIHATGFDLGDIQHGVDQSQQVFGTVQNFIQIFELFFGQYPIGFAAHDAGEADYGIERGAQLMAHVG